MKKAIVYRSQLLPRSETFVRQQVLAFRDWRPVLVGERLLDDGLALDGLDVRVLELGRSSPLARWQRRASHVLRRPAPSLTRELAGLGASVVHVHFGTDAVDLWPRVRDLSLPMLVTLHGYDINIHREWWEAGHGGWRRRRYPARLLELAREPLVSFIAVSEAIRQRAIACGLPSEKVEVRYIGVDTARFRPGDRPLARRARRVLFVGRLVEKKGASLLLQAFARITKRIRDAELLVVGDGPLRGPLESQARADGIPARFLGARTSDEILALMHGARALCLPSITAGNGDAEGLPIVILEAQAAGLPVITSARGGVGEAVLDGETGFAFAEGDVDRLTELIAVTLAGDPAMEALAASARARIERHFDLLACTRDLEASFDRRALPEAPALPPSGVPA